METMTWILPTWIWFGLGLWMAVVIVFGLLLGKFIRVGQRLDEDEEMEADPQSFPLY